MQAKNIELEEKSLQMKNKAQERKMQVGKLENEI